MVFHVIQPTRNHSERRLAKQFGKGKVEFDSLWQCIVWLFSICLFVGIAVCIVRYQEEYWNRFQYYKRPFYAEKGSIFFGGIFLVIMFVLFWVGRYPFFETRFNGIDEMKSVRRLVPYVESLRTTKPTVQIRCESYHWEKSHFSTTERTGKRRTTTTHSSYCKRVVTHRETNEMVVSGWEDTSPPLDITTIRNLDDAAEEIVQVYFSLEWVFMDVKSERVIKSVKDNMFKRNKKRDYHFDIVVDLHIDGFSPKESSKLFYLNKNSIPWYINTFWWSIANIFFLWFPWEVAYQNNLATSQVDIMKSVMISGTVDPLPLDDYEDDQNQGSPFVYICILLFQIVVSSHVIHLNIRHRRKRRKGGDAASFDASHIILIFYQSIYLSYYQSSSE
ncbi:hypothetical protein DFA_00546 [Cavenderia fasciculata]|uniref:Transmembrane protein n=1 Tax=Cavenderia fasciculata TaxID=261658 RepID=F4PSD9_CACFS|nr:uncharacterized protein DFA_00546 [Cavenderia fasciculata]EGG20685.1 hypothetical protein DFA_00546 [Cavenderia fasciculata]|eukprot:XP_004358535.1 hypothetical protein DFA_00546 [Cavenderia fasciculata]